MAKEKSDSKSGVDKIKQLDDLMKELGKKYGQGAALHADKMSEEERKIARWVTRSPKLNDVLGGGIPKGRILEAYGPESGGKTSMGTFMAAEIQLQGGRVAIVDAENSYDIEYAQTLGLDITKTIFSQPSSGEEALGLVEDYCKSNLFDFIIVDSVSALTPQAEIDGEMGDQQMGLQARLMGKGLRKITAIARKTETTIFFINQIRMKIGVMFGNPETTSGGKALAFYASIRLDVRKVEFIAGPGGADDIIGLKMRLTAKKNKTAPPFRKQELNIIFGKGVQFEAEYLDYGVEYGIIDKAGSWYSYKEERLGQGKLNTIAKLQEHRHIYDEIVKRVQERMKGILPPVENANKEKETKE